MKTIVVKNKKKAALGDYLQLGEVVTGAGTAISSAGINNPTATVAGRSMQFAGMGSAFGPIGMGVGALTGAGLGLLEANRMKKEEDERLKKENEANAILAQNRGILLSMNANPDGTPYGFAYGGKLPGTVTPGGAAEPLADDISKLNGNTHEEGGIDIGPVEAEDGEVVAGNYVFSNRLEESSGRTFAQAAEPISKRVGILEEKLKDTTDTYKINGYRRLIESNNAELEALFNKQEQLKAVMQQQQMTMQQQQLGMDPNAMQQGGEQIMAGGGIIPDGEDPIEEQEDLPLEKLRKLQFNAIDPNAEQIVVNPDIQYTLGDRRTNPKDFNVTASRVMQPAGQVPGTASINTSKSAIDALYADADTVDEQEDLPLESLNKAPLPSMEEVLANVPKDANGQYDKNKLAEAIKGFTGNNDMNAYLASIGTSLDNVVNSILINKTPQIPLPQYLDPVLLKTKIDTSSQRREINNAAGNTLKAVGENTANSNVARALMMGTNVEKAKMLSNVEANAKLNEVQLENQSKLNLASINEKNAGKREVYEGLVTKRLAGMQQDASKNVANAQDDLMWNVQRTDLNNYQKAQLLINAIQNPNTAVNFGEIYQQAFAGEDEETRYNMYEALVTGGLKDPEALKTFDRDRKFAKRYKETHG